MNKTDEPMSDKTPTINPPPPVEQSDRDNAYEAALLNLSTMAGQARKIASAANVIAAESEAMAEQARKIASAANVIAAESEAMAEQARQLNRNLNTVDEHDTAPESRR